MDEPDSHEPPPSTDAAQPAVPRRHTRRWFLAGAGAAVLGAAAGAGAGALTHRHAVPESARRAPAELLAAIAAERALIADLDATTGGTAAVRTVLLQARADHAEHLHVLEGIAATYDPPAALGPTAITSSTGAAASPAGTPRSAVELRVAETAAASAGADRAARVDGRLAALLASIAACEATHADLLG